MGQRGCAWPVFPPMATETIEFFSITDSLRTRVRNCTLLQGSLPEPTKCNIHMEHIYTHIIFVGCLSCLIFSKVFLILSLQDAILNM